MKAVFITGFGRCGSTLMDRILGQLPEFTSLGELRDLFDAQGFSAHWCACGQAVLECELWAPVLADTLKALGIDEGEAIRRRAAESRQRHIPRLWWELHSKRRKSAGPNPYGDLLVTLYESVVRHSGTEGVIDSSKFVSDVLILARDPRIELHVIHLVRDPRGAAYSWSRTKEDPGKQGDAMQRFTPFMSSVYWSALNTEVELCLRRFVGSRYQRIRYEDFAEAPQEVLATAVQSWGGRREDLPFVGPNEVRLDTTTHTVGGNPIRFQSGSISLSLDERWRREMPRPELRDATVPALPLLRRYGYPLRPRRI
jgi:hypothetical protein